MKHALNNIMKFQLSISLIVLFSLITELRSDTSIDPDFLKSIHIQSSLSVAAVASNERKALLAIGYGSGEVDVYDGKTATKIMSVHPTRRGSDRLTFSKDGSYLVVSPKNDTQTYIYDIAKKSLLLTFPGTGGPATFTSNNNYLVLAHSSEIKLYDLQKNTWVDGSGTDGVVESLTFNADDSLLAVGTTGKIQLFTLSQLIISDQKSSRMLIPLRTVDAHELKDWILHSWFIGKRLVTLSRFANLDIWSLPDMELTNHVPLTLAFISDAVACDDNQIMAFGVTSHSGVGGERLAEHIDLRTMDAKVITKRLFSNQISAAQWPQRTADGRTLVFVEHAGSITLLPMGDKP